MGLDRNLLLCHCQPSQQKASFKNYTELSGLCGFVRTVICAIKIKNRPNFSKKIQWMRPEIFVQTLRKTFGRKSIEHKLNRVYGILRITTVRKEKPRAKCPRTASTVPGKNFCLVLGRWSILPYSISFIIFTDSLVYWIHRVLHSKYLYKTLHKTHHKWKIPTPFASHAFHPLDGFLQSLPYHIYVFVFPMHKWTYLGLFVFVNVWTVSIHDGNYQVPNALKEIVNGSAHHMDHHLFYSFNYGQFFTFWDRIGRWVEQQKSFLSWDLRDKCTLRRHSSTGKAQKRRTKIQWRHRLQVPFSEKWHGFLCHMTGRMNGDPHLGGSKINLEF